MHILKKVENIFMRMEAYGLFKDRLHVFCKGQYFLDNILEN